MNQKRTYRNPNAVVPDYLHDVSVNGRKLRKGMHLSIPRIDATRIAGRYRFDYAERTPQGVLLLHATGPVSRPARSWRNVTLREEHIKTVHTKSGASDA